MEIRLLTKKEMDKIVNLYENIKNNTYTLWEKNYPSEELINWDIERKGLYGVFEGDKLVAISFAGERCEDDESGFPWKENFKRRGTFARIGVSPEYQNKGIGTLLVNFILSELRKQGFDGVRILAETENVNAIKLYTKFGFVNCGTTKKFGHEYYLFEIRLF